MQKTLSEIYDTMAISLGLDTAHQAYKSFLSDAKLQKEVPLPAFTKQSSVQQFFTVFGSVSLLIYGECESHEDGDQMRLYF